MKRAQDLRHRDPGIRGGIPGSSPIGGDYIQYALPNWAAKFFIDALCAKRDCLTDWIHEARRPRVHGTLPFTVQSAAPQQSDQAVVVFTTRISPTFAALAERWRDRRFSPALVVIETAAASRARRLASAARRRVDDAARICRRHSWRHISVPSVNDANTVAAVERVKPDLAVAAGAGILRSRVLAVPRLGTLNAHMGLLPAYRGMNVAEWSALNGDPVGCSVFFVDDGIDTGPVVVTRMVDTTGCQTIADLRTRVDRVQLDLLDQTVQQVIALGARPATTPQAFADGRQYFRLHPDIRSAVERALRDAIPA